MIAIHAWLVSFMLAFSPAESAVKFRGELSVELVTRRYQSIASDVLAVAFDPSEASRDRTGLALWTVAQAHCESALDWRVDAGKCTRGTCDQGKAWSMWQIHVDDGLVFDGPRFTYARNRSDAWKLEHFAEIADGPALIRDRKLAIRYAIHMRRVSPQLWTTYKCAANVAEAWKRRAPAPSVSP